MSKWLGYTVELFFDGQWFNINDRFQIEIDSTAEEPRKDG